MIPFTAPVCGWVGPTSSLSKGGGLFKVHSELMRWDQTLDGPEFFVAGRGDSDGSAAHVFRTTHSHEICQGF